jgi:hypothetical protein
VDSISARIALYLTLLAVVATPGHAQEAVRTSPATTSTSSTSTQSKQSSPGTDRVILRVGNLQVTEGEFESRIRDIEGQGGDSDKEGATEKDRQRLGDDYASVLMLSQQAVATHLDSSPEVSRQLAIARMQVLSDAAFASLMRQATPSSEEISQRGICFIQVAPTGCGLALVLVAG